MKKPRAGIVRVTEPGTAVREAVSLIGGMGRFVRKGGSVLIKPNLSWRGGLSTRPSVCRALAELSLDAGAGEVVIGEGMLGMSGPTPEHFEKLGYTRMAGELGIRLLNLNECESVDVEIPEALVAERVKVSRPVLETDCLINVPVMKTHFLTGVTLGLKNLKGCLSGHQKSRFHVIGLHKAISDLNRLIRPRLTMIDAITAGEGMGPHFTDDVKLGLLIAADDNLAADIVGATVMGYDPKEVLHLRIFARRTGRGRSVSDVRLSGVPIEEVTRPFVRPPQELEIPEGVSVIQGDKACSGCIGSLAFSFFLFGRNDHLDKIRGYTFVLGRDAEIPEDAEKLFLVGTCTQAHKDRGLFAEGCPPSAGNLPYTLFENRIGFK